LAYNNAVDVYELPNPKQVDLSIDNSIDNLKEPTTVLKEYIRKILTSPLA